MDIFMVMWRSPPTQMAAFPEASLIQLRSLWSWYCSLIMTASAFSSCASWENRSSSTLKCFRLISSTVAIALLFPSFQCFFNYGWTLSCFVTLSATPIALCRYVYLALASLAWWPVLWHLCAMPLTQANSAIHPANHHLSIMQ